MQTQTNESIIAIFCSDIHLSHTSPVWRSSEPDWYDAMKRSLDQLQKLSDLYDAPVICAGDVFDKWSSPPELINFAINNLPKDMACIPGQHDLPMHNLDLIKKSAYWTLVEADVINDYSKKDSIKVIRSCSGKTKEVIAHFFPFGETITPVEKEKDAINILVAHEYTWMGDNKYQGAPITMNYSSKKEQLQGYDIAIFGDNHIGFHYESKNITIFNCGSLMKRHSDQKTYKPMVGLLTDDCKIIPHLLDTKDDVYLDILQDNGKITEFNSTALIEQLQKLGNTSLDFKQTLKQYMVMHKTKKEVRNIFTEIIEGI